MIRTSFTGSYASLRLQTLQVREQLATVTQQSLTGRRVEQAQDDPAAAARILRLRAQLSDQAAWGSNADWAMSLSQSAEDAFSGIENTYQALSELAVQASSETYTASELEDVAVEAESLQEQLVSLGNTQVAGRYLFSGDAYDTAAFDSTGAYQGSTETPSTRVGAQTWVQTGWDGSAVFGDDVDAFTVVGDLVSAMQAGDSDAVSALLDDLETASEQAARYRAANGVVTNVAEDASALAESMETLVSQQLSTVEDVDQAEAYQRFAEMSAAYEAALQISASATQTGSLFDYV